MKEIGKPCTKLQEMVEKFVNVGMGVARSACGGTWELATASTRTTN